MSEKGSITANLAILENLILTKPLRRYKNLLNKFDMLSKEKGSYRDRFTIASQYRLLFSPKKSIKSLKKLLAENKNNYDRYISIQLELFRAKKMMSSIMYENSALERMFKVYGKKITSYSLNVIIDSCIYGGKNSVYKIKKIFSNLRNYIEENQNKFGKYKSWVDWSFYRCKLSLGLIDSMKIKYEKKNIKDYPSNYQYYLYMIDYYFLSKGSVKASKIEYRRLYESTKGTVFEKIFERFSKKERVTRKELYLLKLGLFDYHLK